MILKSVVRDKSISYLKIEFRQRTHCLTVFGNVGNYLKLRERLVLRIREREVWKPVLTWCGIVWTPELLDVAMAAKGTPEEVIELLELLR